MEKYIGLKVNVDYKTLAEFREQLKLLKAELENSKIGGTSFNNLTTAVRQSEAELKKLTNSTKETNTTFQQLKTNTNGATQGLAGMAGAIGLSTNAIGLAVQVYSKFIDIIKESISLSIKEETFEKIIAVATHDNVVETKAWLDLRDKLNKNPLFSKEDINTVTRMAVELGLTTIQAEKVAKASEAISKYNKNIPITEAYNVLARSLGGISRGLAQYDVSLGNLTKKELKHGDALDIIIKKFGDFSDAAGDTETSIDTLQKSFALEEEHISKKFLPTLNILITKIQSIFDVVKKYFVPAIEILISVLKTASLPLVAVSIPFVAIYGAIKSIYDIAHGDFSFKGFQSFINYVKGAGDYIKGIGTGIYDAFNPPKDIGVDFKDRIQSMYNDYLKADKEGRQKIMKQAYLLEVQAQESDKKFGTNRLKQAKDLIQSLYNLDKEKPKEPLTNEERKKAFDKEKKETDDHYKGIMDVEKAKGEDTFQLETKLYLELLKIYKKYGEDTYLLTKEY
jgi:hypothetical protein